MSFLDNITKKASQAVDRAKFEADKLQRTLRLESEMNDLKKQLDGKRLEFGDRALDLFRAGKIQSPTLGSLLRDIETFQSRVVIKEEELRLAQAENFSENPYAPPPPPAAQHVPVSSEPYTPPPSAPGPTPSGATKPCPNCQFQMPLTAQFCPSCGTRVGR
jgi:hypothetical protein